MKLFFTLLILLSKLYLAVRVIWWIFLKFSYPEQHHFDEIEAYVVLLIFDIWIGGQNIEINKIEES